MLEEQLEEMAEKANPTEKDKIEQLKELAEKVAELKKEEQAIQEKARRSNKSPIPPLKSRARLKPPANWPRKKSRKPTDCQPHRTGIGKGPEEVKPAAEIAAKAAEEIAKALPEIEKRAEQGDADLKPELEKAAEQPRSRRAGQTGRCECRE